MSFDNSRFTFDSFKDYEGVVMEQARVQSDADWNEWLAELSRRIRAGTLDIMGHAVYPATTPDAFRITASNTGGTNTISIGRGRMYLDGLLVENHGDRSKAIWDPALAELSGSPQPPPQTDAYPVDFGSQPYYPHASLPQVNGTYLAYLDVWKRPVTYIEDPSLVDVAIGLDTTGRLQTVWQVKLMPAPGTGFLVIGAVTGTTAFDPNEEVVQTNTGANAFLIGTVTGSNPMIIGPITGTADATDTWTGKTSGAVYTPTSAPSQFVSSSTITGSVVSGTFVASEELVQTGTGASANLIGTVWGSNPMTVGIITGNADGNGTWVGQTSKAVYKPSAAPVTATWSCATPDSDFPWPTTSGLLTTGTIPSQPPGPCCLTTGTGYTGVENQFYRVEIQIPGTSGGAGATFKWSRENASVQTTVTAITSGSNSLNKPASVLTVLSLGRDQVLGFSPGNWIEITNQTLDDNGMPGELYQIDTVDVSSTTITLTTLLSNNFPASSLASSVNTYTRICRWDQSGKIYKSDDSVYYDLDATGAGGLPNGFGGIPVPTDGSVLRLENGITAQFALGLPTGSYQPMNYWNFAARTADGSIDLPLTQAPPRGIYHHYTKLSIVTLGDPPSSPDCRTEWGQAGTSQCGCCCTYVVGDGVESSGKYNKIQAAIEALPSHGGEICILPGNYYEHVLLKERKDVVIRGCGWQTHVYSPALRNEASGGTSAAASESESGLTAVFTAVGCEHIEFHSFSVHAADNEVGILLDRSAKTDQTPPPAASGSQPQIIFVEEGKGDTDVTIDKLILTASTRPAILATAVARLRIAETRAEMKNIESLWAAVYLSGNEMFFERNWVGLQASETVSASAEEAPPFKLELTPRTPGGIQIAGPSNGVFVLENEIVRGQRNGITLGNFSILDANGADTGKLTGLLVTSEDPCTIGGSLQLPGTTSGDNPSKIGAGGLIENVYIERNRISKMGMCGIGPVGFFDFSKTLEVISIVNLSITANTISRTLMRAVIVAGAGTSSFGYGAICLPDVQNLIIRDNTVTDFGATPGAEVCGIFLLHGEIVEISRNQIKETRDLSSSSKHTVTSYGGVRAGIFLRLVTPSTLDTSDSSSLLNVESAVGIVRYTPIYVPGIPALRIQENVVRVAIGLALEGFGVGQFEIVNNHFSSGGRVTVSSDILRKFDVNATFAASDYSTTAGALTVAIVNLGRGIEYVNPGNTFHETYKTASVAFEDGFGLADSSNGGVLFTNNVCQLESLVSRVRGLTSVAIASLDHVLFANNQLWLDGPPWPSWTALLDTFVLGFTVQACTNRLQEALLYPVVYSGITFGLANITAQNISTYCLWALPNLSYTLDQQNVVFVSNLCPKG